jgi:hypothetical protein
MKMGPKTNQFLANVFNGGPGSDPIDEILYLIQQIRPSFDLIKIRDLHTEVCSFYSGNHPDYKKNTMPYHNIRHTLMVVLASVRLLHGLHCNKVKFSEETLIKGILAAYFHDSGMLLLENDPASNGTEYIADHEVRSISFLNRYLASRNYPPEIAIDCAVIIQYTELGSNPSTFVSHSDEVKLAGQVVGSADILAQMADRYYLECLPLLFHEQIAGKVNQHDTPLELMEHTAYFYHNVVLKRLITTFSDTMLAMQTHFRERHAINRDLYLENIDKNIRYLKDILNKCEDITCTDKYLKRIPPII